MIDPQLNNPFSFRASENITPDEQFLDLFEPSALEVLPLDQPLWSKVLILHSVPGSGKTSLLRLFTPNVLQKLYKLRSNDNLKELYNKMKQFRVFKENGVNFLGLLNSFRDYYIVDDPELKEAEREFLFYMLFNSRVIICALQNMLQLLNLEYPFDLDKIRIPKINGLNSDSFPTKCNGKELNDWASNLESRIMSFIYDKKVNDGLEDNLLKFKEKLLVFKLLQPENFLYNGKQFFDHSTIMIDDFDRITKKQRRFFLETLFTKRINGIWISERIEALELSKIIHGESKYPKAKNGRDYNIINIDQFWRDERRPKKFEKMILKIADKRLALVDQIPIKKFSQCFDSEIADKRWREIYDRIIDNLPNIHAFKNNIKKTKDLKNPKKAAIDLKAIEFLINRNKKGVQISLLSKTPITNHKKKITSKLRNAAELFLTKKDFKLPLYYGIEKISKISSFNIEQFLEIASKLFENYVSNVITNNEPKALSCHLQEKIIKKRAKSWLESQYNNLINGDDIKKLIEAIVKFASSETYKSTSPYSPGVTGIAISMKDLNTLINDNFLISEVHSQKIRNILQSCITNNLLEPKTNYKCKGEFWFVLYLNRLICAYKDLSLYYGGFREVSLSTLFSWVKYSYYNPKG
ncbi:MAG: hypothetical protein GF308_10300 [Candidatus Heimdallarchaeota archaeon]|nr:hypothetical protein [Candidatus Heimdallarchaeota archaeon]